MEAKDPEARLGTRESMAALTLIEAFMRHDYDTSTTVSRTYGDTELLQGSLSLARLLVDEVAQLTQREDFDVLRELREKFLATQFGPHQGQLPLT